MAIRILGGPGYTVFDIGIATGGVVTPDTVYNYQLPAVPGEGNIDDHLARLYGVDLFFQQGDFLLQGNGDVRLTRGLGAFKANFARSLVTPPGDIFWRPRYGIGLVEFLNARATAGTIYEMKARIQTSLSENAAIEEISRNDVLVSRDPIGLIEIFVDIVLSGQPTAIQLEIRSTV
jgi:hypothetical protein